MKYTNPQLIPVTEKRGYKALTESQLISELLEEEREVLRRGKAMQEKMKHQRM